MLYIKNINGKILKRVLPNNFYNTSKEYAKEYIPSVIYAIVDPCMNSGGCGVFFSKEGANKYYEKNKRSFSTKAGLKSFADIDEVNSFMKRERELFIKCKKKFH